MLCFLTQRLCSVGWPFSHQDLPPSVFHVLELSVLSSLALFSSFTQAPMIEPLMNPKLSPFPHAASASNALLPLRSVTSGSSVTKETAPACFIRLFSVLC